MHILLIQLEGVDLYTTLLRSETSRAALRFYHPTRLAYGVLIATASLGSALALTSELRWYIRRYVQEVLFQVSDSVYCSHALGQQVYERDVTLVAPWQYRCLYIIRDGSLADIVRMEEGTGRGGDDAFDPADEVLEVWCTAEEYSDI